MQISIGYFSSPIGLLRITGKGESIVSVKFVLQKNEQERVSPAVKEAILQLKEYFEGKRTKFDLKLCLEGTDFQKRVWDELQKIPFGAIISYKDLAKKVGDFNHARAVGNAVGKNPAVIVVPCHRVVKSDFSLGGFSDGIDKKVWLLSHEGWRVENGLLRR